MQLTLEARVGRRLHDLVPGDGALGIAVSGGSDSVALLLLARDWAAVSGTQIAAATVNHRLRPEAAREAEWVAALCAQHGIVHRTFVWQDGPKVAAGPGNLQDLARQARSALLAHWAAQEGLSAVALGHTMEDQAETVLMRLARGSGVDGLSGMAPQRHAQGTLWLRPLLGERRASLRAKLVSAGQNWIEDPSNADPASARVRMRHVLELLAPEGITVEGLCATAERLAPARAALEGATLALARAVSRQDRGDLLLDVPGYLAAPREIRERLLAQGLRWVTTAPYRPRHAALKALDLRIAQGKGGTLMGCVVVRRGDLLRLAREERAVLGHSAAPGALWDGRWRVEGPFLPGDRIATLGQLGLDLCPQWRACGLPRRSLVASPAVWNRDELRAAPLTGALEDWRADLVPSFEMSILSH